MIKVYVWKPIVVGLCLVMLVGCLFSGKQSNSGSSVKNPKTSLQAGGSEDAIVNRIIYYRTHIENTLPFQVLWEAVVPNEQITRLSLHENFLYAETATPKLYSIQTDLGLRKWELILDAPIDFPLAPISGYPKKEMSVREQITKVTKDIADEEKKRDSDPERLKKLREDLYSYKEGLKNLSLLDFIYFIAKGKLYCIDRYKGRIIWEAELDFVPITAPLPTLSIVYIGAMERRRIYQFECAKRFAPNWFKIVGDITADPIYEEPSLYIADDTGRIYSFNTMERNERWQYRTERAIKAEIVLDGDTIYVGSTDGALYAVNKYTGVLSWKYEAGNPITAKCNIGTRTVVKDNASYVEQTVYVRIDNDALYAILIEHASLKDKAGTEITFARPKLRWKLPEAKTFLMYGAGQAYILGMDNQTLYAVNIDTGAIKAKYSLEKFPFRAIDPKNGIIYLCSNDGYIMAVKEQLAK